APTRWTTQGQPSTRTSWPVPSARTISTWGTSAAKRGEVCFWRVAGSNEHDRKAALSQLRPGCRGWSVRHPVFDGGDYPSGNGRPVRLLPDRLVPLIAPLEAQGRIER